MITNTNFHYLYRLGKRIRPLFQNKSRFYPHLNKSDKSSKVNDAIFNLIKSSKPFMVARFGSVEAEFIVNSLEREKNNNDITAVYKYLIGEIGINWNYSEKYLDALCKNAGFFPKDEELAKSFIDLYLSAAKNLDVLGVWNGMEDYIPTIPENIILGNIRELEPWFFNNPWTKALEGKKILVIHPFENTIQSQYLNRDNYYKDKNIVPKFELKTIKAVQSIADENAEFTNWFEALDFMKQRINTIDFDVAILGCGAYGFPLASYIKDIGKQAIHLGGVTQLLFGIKGKRWEDWNHYTSLRGNGWVYADEKPKGFEKIEGGCYW